MTQLPDKTVRQSEDAMFETVVHGFPTPTVKWYLHERDIGNLPEGKYQTESVGNMKRLTIRDCGIEETGVVEAEVCNTTGSIKGRAHLIVGGIHISSLLLITQLFLYLK